MTSTVFQQGTTITHDWLNDVNATTYTDLPNEIASRIAADALLMPTTTLAASTGTSLVGHIATGTGAVARTVQSKLRETVSVKDFGAIGTANIANESADTAAFLAAMATGKNVIVPEGTYYVSQTINIGYSQVLRGAGRAKTYIYYSGSGTGIYMGSSAPISLIFWCELHDLTICCTSRASTVVGVELENCVMFSVSNVSSFGSGSPNSTTPADRVLYGNGIYIHNNTIIGSVRSVESRLWFRGFYLKTDTGSQSYWTAATVFDGQCYVENCMRGVVVGDPTIPLYSGVGVAFRDMTIQGCYTSGMNINSGDNTVIDNCYFEGNANYDITVGSFATGAPKPIGVKIINSSMSSENIGTTPYGTFPYIAKIYIDDGDFTVIKDNNMSITAAIPLISLARGEETEISGNRLNSTIAVTNRILNNGVATITHDNHPEAATVGIGTIIRALDAASGDEVYTGFGFQPTSIEFVAAVDTAVEQSIGFCGITNGGLKDRCVTSNSTNAKSTSNNSVKIIKPTAADISSAVIKSFDKDGFTLTWTKSGTPTAGVNLQVSVIARRS